METTKKNYAKRDSYALASKLIDEAIVHNFPLQAITIEESIISDRLWSALKSVKVKSQKHESMGTALEVWKNLRKDSSKENPFDEEMENLREKLTNWWDRRNKLIHGIAKSPVGGRPQITAVNFVKSAVDAANDGKELVRIVKNWSQKKIRKAKRASSKI